MSELFECNPVQAMLILQHIKGIGPVRLQQLLEHFKSPQAILSASREDLAELGTGKLLMTLADKLSGIQDQAANHSLVKAAEKEMAYCAENDIQIVISGEPMFPQILEQAPAAPALLYVKGNLEALNKPQLAIVGARNASSEGKKIARAWAQTLAAAGLVITSGLAEGIDAAAHQGALDAKAETLAVVAHGLDSLYPQCHQTLSADILDNGGALVSEFAIGMKAQREYFPRRNRIISGLSLGVCIIEAAIKSGSLITARFAIEQNRQVYALPSHINNIMAEGCHYLIQQGAELVTKPEDILEQLLLNTSFNYSLRETKTEKNNKATTAVAEKESSVLLHELSYNPMHFDELIKNTSLVAEQLSVELMQLEMQGLILSEAGFYRRV